MYAYNKPINPMEYVFRSAALFYSSDKHYTDISVLI